MLRQLDELKASVIALQPQALAYRCGGIFQDGQLVLTYWGRQVAIGWPDLQARFLTGEACPVFDTTLLLFYLRSADGEPLGDRWISFRELPGGAFYHQAYQGYSGDQMARYFVDRQAAFHEAARALDSVHLQSLAEFAYAFLPLPAVLALGWRVHAWHTAYKALPEVEARLSAEVACAAGSECQKRVEAAVARQNENTIEVLNNLEAELVEVRNRPVPRGRVIRVCPDSGGGGVSLPEPADGSNATPAPGELVSGTREFDPKPLFELAREADEIVARCRGLQEWTAALAGEPD